MRSIKDGLKFNYEHPDIFYLPQWQTGNEIDTFFMVYKVLLTAFYVGVFIILFYAGQHFPVFIRIKAGCYYTFWIFFVCAVSSVVTMVSVGREFWRQRRNVTLDADAPPARNLVFHKIQWILHTMTLDSSIAVTLGYFSLEFFYHLRPYGAGTSTMHLWNTLLVMMDFFICSMPVKIIHMYPSLILAFLYGIFTYVYYLSGGLGIYNYHYLYKMLDYKHRPVLACLALLTVLLYLFIGRLFVCFAHRMKQKVYYRFYYCNEQNAVTRHVPVAN